MTDAEIEALVSKVVTTALASQQSAHEAEIAKLRKQNSILLDDKKQAERHAAARAETDRVMALADKFLNGDRNDASGSNGPHTIDRQAARNPQAYREARARAEKAGVPLRIVDDAAAAQAERTVSRVKMIETDKEIWVSKAYRDHVGPMTLHRQAEAKGKVVRPFASWDDLPPELIAKHDFLAGAGGDNVVGGDA